MSKFKLLYHMNENNEYNLFNISKIKLRKVKRSENLFDGEVFQEISIEFKLLQDNWDKLYDEYNNGNLNLKIFARINSDGSRPKQQEKVWNILNKKDKWLLLKVAYKEALEFSKKIIKNILKKNNLV